MTVEVGVPLKGVWHSMWASLWYWIVMLLSVANDQKFEPYIVEYNLKEN